METQPRKKDGLVLHSGQGSQYTSKAFVGYCKSVHITQSMSKAGYPYDNAPMERYFSTLKNECTNLYGFRTEEELYRTVEERIYQYIAELNECPVVYHWTYKMDEISV